MEDSQPILGKSLRPEQVEAFLAEVESMPLRKLSPRHWVSIGMLSRMVTTALRSADGGPHAALFRRYEERVNQLLVNLSPTELRALNQELRRLWRELSTGSVAPGGAPWSTTKDAWDRRWRNPAFNPPWARSTIDEPLVRARDDGWLGTGRAIDVGCGEGVIAAWLAENGFETFGVDISAHVIQKASERWAGRPNLSFGVRDMTEVTANSDRYDVIIDRGCLHSLPADETRQYAANLMAMAAPGARLMLITHLRFNPDPEKRRRELEALLGPRFSLVETEMTRLDGPSSSTPIPGMALRFLFD